ncbi:MAG: prepilin-type N-terminal cleavage/methylation domain-containing protein [Proteobacteria bacterium]|nr:prepilin-type N-terminal cleavage/methylation domain-containing protein [Pseudomonadota bacterium]
MPKTSLPSANNTRSLRQRGFTLIELIAVIIILGILAAVIVPKYFDMTGKAKDTAYKSALSEAGSRVNLAYSMYIVETGIKPATLSNLANATLLGGTDLSAINVGDYDASYSLSGTTVTVVLNSPGKTDNLATGTTPWPQ